MAAKTQTHAASGRPKVNGEQVDLGTVDTQGKDTTIQEPQTEQIRLLCVCGSYTLVFVFKVFRFWFWF